MALSDNLIAYYKFDENTGSTVGNIIDSANTGTWQGTLGSQWTSAKLGVSAGNFNGTDNWVSLATGGQMGSTGSFSLACWVKYASAPAAQVVIIRKDNDGGTGGWGMGITQEASGGFTGSIVYTSPSTVQVDSTESAAPSTGVWHHFVAVWKNGLQISLYLDGSKTGSGGTTSGITLRTSNQVSTIGATSTPASFFSGQIDEVGFWNRALTVVEIALLYNYGNGLAHPFSNTPSVHFYSKQGFS